MRAIRCPVCRCLVAPGDDYANKYEKTPFHGGITVEGVAVLVECNASNACKGSDQVGLIERVLPVKKMYWREIPAGSHIDICRLAYIATLSTGDEVMAYWKPSESRNAQLTLRVMAKRKKVVA